MLQPPKGELAFQISGGPFDGERTVVHLRSDRPIEQRGNIAFMPAWSNSRGGEVGRWFCVLSDGFVDALRNAEAERNAKGENEITGVTGQQHWYEVVKREDNGDDVTVYCDYRGIDGPPSIMRTGP